MLEQPVPFVHGPTLTLTWVVVESSGVSMKYTVPPVDRPIGTLFSWLFVTELVARAHWVEFWSGARKDWTLYEPMFTPCGNVKFATAPLGPSSDDPTAKQLPPGLSVSTLVADVIATAFAQRGVVEPDDPAEPLAPAVPTDPPVPLAPAEPLAPPELMDPPPPLAPAIRTAAAAPDPSLVGGDHGASARAGAQGSDTRSPRRRRPAPARRSTMPPSSRVRGRTGWSRAARWSGRWPG